MYEQSSAFSLLTPIGVEAEIEELSKGLLLKLDANRHDGPECTLPRLGQVHVPCGKNDITA